ncbi:MAG: thiol:disulfide interchange protein DsbA/DsbL [Gammaproteobacteria bacterium]|nr:thiol:disulfide interchange protein DsbA/DsbL [Gammaproteobacteria bacterium]
MTKVERVRIVLLSALGAILVLVIGYSTLYALNLVPGWGTSTERTYNTLDRPLRDDPIEIIEFFSYACPHCSNLDPMLAGWIDGLGEDVEFKRVHVAVDTLTTRLAKTYLVLESQGLLEQNHRRIFDAIHERNITFLNDEQIAEFMHDRGIESDRFLSAFNGRYITRSIESSRQLAVDTRNIGVPALLIANKFQITARGGNRQILSTAQWLVDEIQAGRDPSIVPDDPSAAEIETDTPIAEDAS